MCTKRVSIWDADGGAYAECYANKPHGHYKEEVYPLFVEFLAALGDGARVLDIGAGPGHLAVEFYRRHPHSRTRFALMDAGRALLDIAARRLGDLGISVECYQRSFGVVGWHTGLGTYDAVVSNNAIFHVRPGELPGFYETVCGLLKRDGLFLNQQAFAWEHAEFADVAKALPGTLSPERLMSSDAAAAFDRLRAETAELAEAARGKAREEVERLRSEGHEVEVAQEGGYASLHVPVSVHVQHLRAAGLAAGCIWRKMEFAVLAGVKGDPWPRGGGADTD